MHLPGHPSLIALISPSVLLPLAVGLAGCGADASHGEQVAIEQASLDPAIVENRSLAVTEKDIVSQFSLQDVLQQLLTEAQITGQTPLDLFRSWAATTTSCDEVVGGVTVPQSFNGFPFTCSPEETTKEQEPFSGMTAYAANGLFNRFDLAPADGSNCGEYRLVFGRTEVDAQSRKSLIFEARLPNPQPSLGLEGCRPVANFWASLSGVASNAERARLLKDFYFLGLPGFEPVIALAHYQRSATSGRVRTNSFLNARSDWSMREFGLRKLCDPSCHLEFVRVPTGDNPYFLLTGPVGATPLAQSFQDWFVSSLAPGRGLLGPEMSELTMGVPERFLMGESRLPEFIGAPSPPPRNLSDEASPAFASRVQARLAALNVNLTAAELINRAESATCTGCHRSSAGDDVGFTSASGAPLPFPTALPFRQIDGNQSVVGKDGPRFKISSALTDTFLPFRKANLERFLNAAPSSLHASLSLQSSWDQGYCAIVTVNNTGTASADYRAQLVLGASQVTNSWQGTFVRSEDTLIVTRPSWAGPLAAGAAMDFGFCATKTSNWVPPTVAVSAL